MAKRKYVKENNLVKAINTDSLKLQKPLVNEYYDINVHNSNMDKIDAGYKQNKNDISNINYELSNINYELSKTENTKYTAANGIKEFSCKDGYVDNVVIEGKTLVNLVSPTTTSGLTGTSDIGTPYVRWSNADMANLITNGTFTLFNLSDKQIQFAIRDNVSPSTINRNIYVSSDNSLVVSLSGSEHIRNFFGYETRGWDVSEEGAMELYNSVIILKGNHTDKSISHFEGLKSVGQGDKIEVMTYSDDIEVIYEESNVSITNDTGNDTWFNKDGVLINSANDLSLYNVEITESGWYTLQNIDIDENVITVQFLKNDYTTYTSENRYVYLYKGNYVMRYKIPKGKTGVVRNVSLVKIEKLEKKYAYTTLRSLPNGVKDTIEKRGNKYVKVQRCGEVVLGGNVDISEIYKPNHNTSLNYRRFLVRVGETPSNGTVFCDRLGSVRDYEIEKDNIFSDKTYGGFFVTLHNDKAGGTTEGFKTWLQANPITVVYELATPQIIELPNFNPQTYSDNTTLLLNSGVIQAEADFEVTNSMGSEIDVLKSKVSSLDDNIVEVHEPQLLNGFYKLYTEDDSYIRKYNNVVVMNLRLSNPANVSDGTLVFTLPPRFRPPARVSSNVCDGLTGMATGILIVRNDGSVVVYKSTNSSDIRVNIVYMAR